MARQRDTYIAKYKDVAASQTGAAITTRSAGAVGDYIDTITIIPETVSAGTIALLDGVTSVNIFISGTLSNLAPITLHLKCRSTTGGWSITTGAAVHVRISGNF